MPMATEEGCKGICTGFRLSKTLRRQVREHLSDLLKPTGEAGKECCLTNNGRRKAFPTAPNIHDATKLSLPASLADSADVKESVRKACATVWRISAIRVAPGEACTNFSRILQSTPSRVMSAEGGFAFASFIWYPVDLWIP